MNLARAYHSQSFLDHVRTRTWSTYSEIFLQCRQRALDGACLAAQAQFIDLFAKVIHVVDHRIA